MTLAPRGMEETGEVRQTISDNRIHLQLLGQTQPEHRFVCTETPEASTGENNVHRYVKQKRSHAWSDTE